MEVKFTVYGEPCGKGRPRFSKVGTYVKAYTPEKTAVYENLVKLEYQIQCRNYRFPDGSPLEMRIIAYHGIPKSASKKKQKEMTEQKIRPLKKCDWDNIGKIIADSLNEIAYKDDVQIVDGRVSKFYSDKPRVEVTIREATDLGRCE